MAFNSAITPVAACFATWQWRKSANHLCSSISTLQRKAMQWPGGQRSRTNCTITALHILVRVFSDLFCQRPVVGQEAVVQSCFFVSVDSCFRLDLLVWSFMESMCRQESHIFLTSFSKYLLNNDPKTSLWTVKYKISCFTSSTKATGPNKVQQFGKRTRDDTLIASLPPPRMFELTAPPASYWAATNRLCSNIDSGRRLTEATLWSPQCAPKRVLEEQKRGRSRFLYDPANKPSAYWGRRRRRRKLNALCEQIALIVEQQTKSHKVWSYSSPHPLRKSASSLSLQTYDWVWLLEQKHWWRTRDPSLLFGLISG